MEGQRKIVCNHKKNVIRYLYNKSDKIITVSNKIRLDLMDNYGIKKEKLVTIFNPYPIKKSVACQKKGLKVQRTIKPLLSLR